MVGRQQRDMERRYSIAEVPSELSGMPPPGLMPSASEDLHAWSIYRQNLNSDFTDSALGSSEKSPLPYGNFQLRESTVQSILSHPRYGPKSALGSNMYTYLKFGLPRVFPPNGVRGGRDGSSGYDSSDDGGGGGGNGTAARPRPRARHASQQHLHAPPGYYLRARSDPDFRNTPYHGPSMPLRQQMGGPGGGGGMPPPPHQQHPAGGRGKSVSEANLLAPELLMRHNAAPYEHRRSVHDLRGAIAYSELGGPPPHVLVHNARHGGRPASVAVVGTGHHHPAVLHRHGSHSVLDGGVGGGAAPSMLSGMAPPSSRAHSALRSHDAPPGMSFQVHRGEAFSGAYPHLQVRGLDVDGKNNEPLLQSVSFEAKAGEILAVMATQVDEGRAILDILSGTRRARTIHIVLNGQSISQRVLRKRVAYVRSDCTLAGSLSVSQTLAFYSRLRRPPRGPTKVSSTDQMDLLIEELGLTQVLDTKVASLTDSEAQRLSLACHLVSDAEILLLDRPTRSMDIFDTFFLVEFLRQWAGGSSTGGLVGRIVVLTIQPPTYEIFTMVSRVLLLSGGRMMYSGRRRDMLPYFSAADYPCPAFKNPSDYYLDLVTLDDLSAEAMLESSQRIEQLAELFRRRQEPLSDPGPPQALPGKTRTANLCSQAVALLMRQLIYSQPTSLTNWLTHVLLAAILSLIVGAIFWDVPKSDPQLLYADRIGFHYTMMCVASLPILLMLTLSDARSSERAASEMDIRDGLYSRLIFIIITAIISFPAVLFVWLAYIIPAYAMTALYNQGSQTPNGFHIYISTMLVHMMCLYYTLRLISQLWRSRRTAAIASGLVLVVFSLVSGYPVYLADVPPWQANYFGLVSPVRWMMPSLLAREYSPVTLAAIASQMICNNRQVQQQDIIVQLPCPIPNGTAALSFYGLSPKSAVPFNWTQVLPYWPPVIIALAMAVLHTVIFLFRSPTPAWKKEDKLKRYIYHPH
ncbi:ATP-binding cassette sub-family G member 8 [Nilaparvata lugens]|uniref:ATP-binding cassette transporter sub-family G member 5 n=1 Tax=Nilaparvata lugens TaxID=108931 RepID=A0A6G7SLE9_NILLU|nr:ATP-binding cassette sub-family G member 8 [Nilaparvata lugens]QIK02752.1 ATP-binding cassette transporter sub-family G member 5 [Nilaparvata lugens]